MLLLQTAFKLKIFSVFLGLINVLITAQYYDTDSVFEVFLLTSIVVSFAVSVMYLTSTHYLGKSYKLTVRKCDAAIHFVIGVITFSVSTVFLIMMIEVTGRLCDTRQDDCFSRIAFRIVLGVMCIINSVIYGIICYLLISDDNEYEIL